jgi:prephenate dehydrogenase
MKILIMGLGHMGGWLLDALGAAHDVAVYDSNREKLDHAEGAAKLLKMEDAAAFAPELVINAVSLPNIGQAFEAALPHLPEGCLLSDIASVKTGLADLYRDMKRRFVSTHPMFGPTFANFSDLSEQNAIIIEESDPDGKAFFKEFYENLGISVHDYTFDGHDRTIAYSLSIPFASTMVFAACMKNQKAPGSTFKKHLDIAKGLLSKDDHLLGEILFNPYTIEQIETINSSLTYLTHIIRGRDREEMDKYLDRLRENISERHKI